MQSITFKRKDVFSILIEGNRYFCFFLKFAPISDFIVFLNKDDILFYYPNADLSNDSKFFNFACDYLENYGKNVVSCDQAKINEVYLL